MKDRELGTDIVNGVKHVRPVKIRRTPACDHCGDALTDKDRDNTDGHDTLGFKVRCDTCKKPLRLCEDCWNNNNDDCLECEEKYARCPACFGPVEVGRCRDCNRTWAQADRADREHVARAESFRKQLKMTQTGASEKMNRPALRGDNAMATAKQAVSKMFEGTGLHHVSIFRKAICQAKEENDRGNVINAIKSLRNHLPLGLKEAKDLNHLIRQAVDYAPANGYDWIAYVEEHWHGPRGEASTEIEPIIEVEPITQAAPQPAAPQVIKQPKNKKAKRLNIEMAQRHLAVVKKWLGAGYLTEAQAEQLTRETVARVVGE